MTKSYVIFKEMSEELLDNILKISRTASQIHVVFDVYKIGFNLKCRANQKIIRDNYSFASQKIKQWNKFLSSGHNKMQHIDFIVNQWQL